MFNINDDKNGYYYRAVPEEHTAKYFILMSLRASHRSAQISVRVQRPVIEALE